MSGTAEEDTIRAVKEAFPAQVEAATVLRKKRLSISVKPESLLEVARYLKQSLGFKYPVSAGGIDYINQNQFQVVYYLMSPEKQILLMLRVTIPRERPVLQSMTQIYDAMSYHERETWEMFGIQFDGHPNLIKLLLPEDWDEGYPLRKDFKLKGEGIGS